MVWFYVQANYDSSHNQIEAEPSSNDHQDDDDGRVHDKVTNKAT